MSEARRARRKQHKRETQHFNMLANLLGNFYEFLSKSPQPSDGEVRKAFTSYNDAWRRYCATNKLMNSYHLFNLNVSEAWKRHTVKPQSHQ